MTLREMVERRAALVTEMETLNAQHSDAFPADAQTRWDELRASHAQIEQRIERQTTIDNLARQSTGQRIGGGSTEPERRAGLDGFDGQTIITQHGQTVPVLEARHRLADFQPRTESRAAELGIAGFLKALYRGADTELERRVLAESSIGTGGALVPTPLAASVIDQLRAQTVAFRAGARTVPMDSATLTAARVIKTPVGSWRAENALIVEDQPAFDQVRLTAKSWALRFKISRELLEDGQNTDAAIRTALSASGALGLDHAIMWGAGTATEPLGVANTPGVQAVPVNGALTNWDPVLDGIEALEMVNAGDVSAMVLSPRTARAVNGFKDSQANPLTAPARVSGIPRLTTTAVPINEGANSNASSIILGDFSQVWVGMRTQMQISVLNELYAENGQVGFIAWLRADVLVVQPQALAKLTGITGA